MLQRFCLILVLMASFIAPAGAQEAKSPPSAQSANSVKAYRINPGDELTVSVWGDDRLLREVRVLPDGTFSFPLVGRVVAQGYLPSEVETLITAGLADQYRGQVPRVTVSVSKAAGMQFSVVGRVNSPGTFTPDRYVNILEALSMAGGPTEFANLNNVLIVRKVGGELSPLHLRLATLFERGASASDISRANVVEIMTGDTVIVP